ncbi:hypothetical protein CLOM_g24650 [Closterium sp. NIES-68]|nr:hypothetical protein CLOM_g24650 [Closterium sp. NIES-68]
MGHVALPILQQIVKQEMVSGIRVKGEPNEVLGCPTCMQAKFTRYPFHSSETTAKAPLDEVVMDVKSDVAETVKTDWLPMVERQQDRLVKAIRTDRGGEFLSKDFSTWLKKQGIRHSLTMPYSPAMNGIAERANRTLTETARGLLIEAGNMGRAPGHGSKQQGMASLGPIYQEVLGEQRLQVHGELTVQGVEGGEPSEDCSTITRQSPQMNGDEEEEEVQQGDERAPSLPPRATSDDAEDESEECAFAFFSPVEMPGEPTNPKEAWEGPNGKEWKKASDEEMGSIIENDTFDLVNLPPGRKAISSKWLFKRKTDADGNIERYKSRLVAKGYQQQEKKDYNETYMEQPEGYNDGSGRVWKLKKALYGLKQAPRQWYIKLREVLEAIGFTPSTADQSLFMLGEGEQRSFMVVYVDDILIFSPSSDLVKEVMLKLQDKFKCKTLGDVNYYLGLHIERDVEKRWMRVHQKKYLEALAANFGKSEGHVATPLPSGFKCVKGPAEESVGEEERRRFHSLVGSLMYAAVHTRPDAAFATGQLARVVQCPNEEQVAAGERGGQVPWPNSNCWTAILRGGTKASKGCGWSRTREALSHRLL